jgi:hypothetical protein
MNRMSRLAIWRLISAWHWLKFNHTVEVSVQAWEKRGYWVKADRFRMEWEWTETVGQSMQEALIREDWAAIAALSARTAAEKVTVAERNRIGTPWLGAWKQLKAMKNKKNAVRFRTVLFLVFSLFLFEDDAGVDDFEPFAFFINQDRVGI